MDEQQEVKFDLNEPTQFEKIVAWRWTLVVLIIAETAFSFLYGLLRHVNLEHSGALFIGLPLVLAILLTLAGKAKSAVGGIMRGITIALLIVAPLLGEGMICILMSAPIFYAVGLVVALLINLAKRASRGTKLSCTVLMLLPFCLEGVVPQMTHERAQSVVVSEVVAAPEQDVVGAMSQSPRISDGMPAFWKIGFPRPLSAHGEGLEVGATRTIRFSAAEGMPEGDLVMRVASSDPRHVRFVAVSDQTKIGKWMQWKNSDVRWEPMDGSHTRVTWQIDFDRGLDPAFYFGPLERAAVRAGAKYLIANNATPAGEPQP